MTIITEQEFTFQSGMKGMRFEIDSMGRSLLFVTDLSQRTIILTCFGDFTMVDDIASTLKASN